MIRALSFLLFTACFGVASTAATANEAYPSKTVRVVVPYPAGGVVDQVVRVFTERLSKQWSQPIVVDNKAGANGNIGTAEALKGAADGHTLLVHGPAMVANPALYDNLPWHPSRNFRALAVLAWVPQIAVVPEELGAKTMKDLEALARKDPNKLFFAVPGAGSGNNLSSQLFLQSASIQMTPVMYKGQPEAVLDLLTNRVNFMFVSPSAVLQHIKAGKLRALAVASSSRLEMLPDTPTMTEAGYPAAVRPFWFSLFGLAGTPEPVLAKINADIAKLAATAEVQTALKTMGYQPSATMSVAQLDALIKSDTDAWGNVIRTAKIKAE
jgi:tripartite-type tricarboxylate transporter receptor subunit TctC